MANSEMTSFQKKLSLLDTAYVVKVKSKPQIKKDVSVLLPEIVK